MILVDVHEPDEMVRLLSQALETKQEPLNEWGWSDYVLTTRFGTYQFSRKQMGELMGDVDNAEKQLVAESRNCENTSLLAEGVIVPTALGCDVYAQSLDKPYFRMVHSYGTESRPRPGAYTGLYAWFWQLEKCGVVTYFTNNLLGSARALVAFHNSAEKSEHQTMHRYLRQRPPVWEPNPQVEALWGLVHPLKVGWGVEKCEKLVQHFGSVGKVLWAAPEEVAEVLGIKVESAAMRKWLELIAGGG